MRLRAVLCVLSVAFGTTPALAQQNCSPIDEMDVRLRESFGEVPALNGINEAGNPVSIYVNPDTGTWTFLFLSPKAGMACIGSSGDGWLTLPAPLPGDPT